MSKSIYSYSAQNVGNGFNNFVETNDFSRREPDLGNVEDLEQPLEDTPKSKKKFQFPFLGSTSTTQYLDLTNRQRKRQPQEPYQQFVGIGDFIDDDADRIINNIPKNEDQQSKANSFRQDVEDLTAEKKYAFKQSLHGEFRIREGHQRVATIKQSGSMTWSKSDVAGPDIQDYVKLLCKHKLANQTKPVGLTVNEKLITNEQDRIAFFRNTIVTLLENDIDFERIKIHNKEYRYLLDEFAPKKVADVGLENGKQERVEPKLEDGKAPDNAPKTAMVGDAPANEESFEAPKAEAPKEDSQEKKEEPKPANDGDVKAANEEKKEPDNKAESKDKGVKLEKEPTDSASQSKDQPEQPARIKKLQEADSFLKAQINEDMKPLDVANHVYKSLKTVQLYIAANEFDNANSMMKKTRVIVEHYKAPGDVIKGVKHLDIATRNAEDLSKISGSERLAIYKEDIDFAAKSTGSWLNEIKPKLSEEEVKKDALKDKKTVSDKDILDAGKDAKPLNENKILDDFKQSEIDEDIKKSTKRNRMKP